MGGENEAQLAAILEQAGLVDLPADWEVVQLGTLLADDRGISVGVMYPGAHDPTGVPLVRAGDLSDHHLNLRPEFRISPEVHHEYRRTALEGGELLMTLVGNVGSCAVVPDEMRGGNVARAIAVIRLRDSGAASYVRACLQSRQLRHLMDVWSNTTVQQTLNLKEIRQLPIPWPSSGTRDRIARILGALDDKIELNRKMNSTLEAMARALFKSWFVDFDPVRRNMEAALTPGPSPMGRGEYGNGEAAANGEPSPPGRGRRPKGAGEGAATAGENSAYAYRGGAGFTGLLEYARALRAEATPAERVMWELVRDRRFMGLKFRRQHQFLLYIADFYCREARLVVELDGGSHVGREASDAERDREFEAHGVMVVRFSNNDVLHRPESVLERLAEVARTRLPNVPTPSPAPSPLPLGEGPGVRDHASTAYDHLFPSEFVESELGRIPRGWSSIPVYGIATYVNGAAYQAFQPNEERRGLPIIKIAELKAGVTPQTRFSDVAMPAKYRLRNGDILFSWSGNPDTSIDTFVWAHGDAWLNQHIFRVDPHYDGERSFVLATLKYLRPVFAEIARDKQTTGLGHVTVGDLQRLRVVKPDGQVLAAWERVAAPLLAAAFRNELESASLARLRDELLPRLLSGELSVGEVERAAVIP